MDKGAEPRAQDSRPEVYGLIPTVGEQLFDP